MTYLNLTKIIDLVVLKLIEVANLAVFELTKIIDLIFDLLIFKIFNFNFCNNLLLQLQFKTTIVF